MQPPSSPRCHWQQRRCPRTHKALLCDTVGWECADLFHGQLQKSLRKVSVGLTLLRSEQTITLSWITLQLVEQAEPLHSTVMITNVRWLFKTSWCSKWSTCNSPSFLWVTSTVWTQPSLIYCENKPKKKRTSTVLRPIEPQVWTDRWMVQWLKGQEVTPTVLPGSCCYGTSATSLVPDK